MEAASTGSELRAGELWEAIDAVVPRAELRAALATIGDLVPALGAADDDKDVRAALVTRIVTVSGFVKTLTEVISFGANAEASRSWRP
jgi:predicted benzoate:H+ symporter BenE